VEHFVSHTRNVLDRPPRVGGIPANKRGNTLSLLKELAAASAKLKEIEDQAKSVPAVRPSKQKVASCAFEVAKWTKSICEVLGM
jgi:hypothetical protein